MPLLTPEDRAHGAVPHAIVTCVREVTSEARQRALHALSPLPNTWHPNPATVVAVATPAGSGDILRAIADHTERAIAVEKEKVKFHQAEARKSRKRIGNLMKAAQATETEN